VQDAFTRSAERWPVDGAPRNAGAWIVTTARNRAIDLLRRDRTFRAKAELLARLDALPTDEDDVTAIPDERLALVFTCCHPALPVDARVALTLREVCGLTTTEIARAFLTTEPAMAQRLVRAKRRIRDTGIPFRVPPAHLLVDRVPAVLGVVYLVFNEGYLASEGGHLVRRDLCSEAIRLAKLLCVLMPDEPVAFGLLALLLLQDSRRDARVGPDGELVLLADQDRSLWDADEIEEAQRMLERAARLGRPGTYQLQTAIAAAHAAGAGWETVARLYERLREHDDSPVVQLNHAVAIALSGDLDVGLALIDALGGLDSYPYLHAARADMLRRGGRMDDASRAYRRALELTANDAERRFLTGRLAELDRP
jgi:RNA polymerase sigma-70 factor (ECF subfamily)